MIFLAVTTIHTCLFAGETKEALTKMVPIKDYPDLIGEPELLESTTLDDEAQTYEPGVKSVDILAFTANYTSADYDKCEALANKHMYYELRFGENAEDGAFEWEGKHTMGLTGGDVNAIADMTINIVPSTEVKKKTVTQPAG